MARETGADVHTIQKAGYFPQREIREVHTWEEMVHWLFKQMDMVMKWIINIRRTEKQDSVERACIYMENYCNEGITLQEVADHVGKNSTYFSLLFKEKMGMTYIQYLTHIRIEMAKDLLLGGGKVVDVSEQVGYHSYRHFSELFRKKVGVNPSQYKDSLTESVF